MSTIPGTYEAVEVGDTYGIDGTYEVTKDEIVEFAERWDPQPFHVDEEAAAESMFGGIVASGWHTCAMTMRLLVDGLLAESGAQAAVGADDLRWHEPVRPGDVLSLEIEVVDKRDWFGGQGLVRGRVEVYTDPDLVMSVVGLVLWEREGG